MQVLEANPQSIADYKAGKDRALGFLVGQAMKATKGKANPQMLNYFKCASFLWKYRLENLSTSFFF